MCRSDSNLYGILSASVLRSCAFSSEWHSPIQQRDSAIVMVAANCWRLLADLKLHPYGDGVSSTLQPSTPSGLCQRHHSARTTCFPPGRPCSASLICSPSLPSRVFFESLFWPIGGQRKGGIKRLEKTFTLFTLFFEQNILRNYSYIVIIIIIWSP